MTHEEAKKMGATHIDDKTNLLYKWDGFCLFVLINGWWVFKSNEFNHELKPL